VGAENSGLGRSGYWRTSIDALRIAGCGIAYGWWEEAIALDRNDDMLTLRFRDYPRLPKFFRHRTAVALMSPPAEQ
jgi:hypothetical protein